MTSPARVMWRRRSPRRAIARLGWVGFFAVLGVGATVLLFGEEPPRVESGALNPLALIVPAAVLLFALLALPGVLGLLRRPIVTADHYAMTVRPGAGRTLVLPWAQVVELAAVWVRDEPVLLIRCRVRRRTRRSADWPRYWDRGVLRSVRRSAGRTVDGYDLALYLSDFLGHPGVLLYSLVAVAPPRLAVLNRL